MVGAHGVRTGRRMRKAVYDHAGLPLLRPAIALPMFAWQLSGGQTRAFKTAKFTKVLKVMRLLKLSKILKGSKYLEAFEDWFSMQRCAHSRGPPDRPRVCARV